MARLRALCRTAGLDDWLFAVGLALLALGLLLWLGPGVALTVLGCLLIALGVGVALKGQSAESTAPNEGRTD